MVIPKSKWITYSFHAFKKILLTVSTQNCSFSNITGQKVCRVKIEKKLTQYFQKPSRLSEIFKGKKSKISLS